MKMSSEGPEMPLALGLALSQNLDAMNRFSALSREEQQGIIRNTENIKSKKEMRAYVQSLVN
jgi:hypothetical protein